MVERPPATAYREIIDALVGRTGSVAEDLLRAEGTYSRAPGDEPINAFVRSLTDAQRVIIAVMCRAERVGAIHDVLAEFSWWIDCEDLAFTLQGEVLTVDESGVGLHGDFIGRLEGWSWPD